MKNSTQSPEMTFSVLDDKTRVRFDGLTRKEANELVRKMLEEGREPVEICAGATEWFEQNYPDFSSYAKQTNDTL